MVRRGCAHRNVLPRSAAGTKQHACNGLGEYEARGEVALSRAHRRRPRRRARECRATSVAHRAEGNAHHTFHATTDARLRRRGKVRSVVRFEARPAPREGRSGRSTAREAPHSTRVRAAMSLRVL